MRTKKNRFNKKNKTKKGGGKCLKKLGEGNYGIIYECKRNNNNVCYALKSKKYNKNVNVESQKECILDDEISILKKLDNVNIIKFIETGEEKFKYGNQDIPVLFMMELGDESLSNLHPESNKKSDFFKNPYFKNTKSLSFTYEFVRQLLNGLCYLYKNRICHFDIKPENILIKQQNDTFTYKITDFGLSKEITNDNKKIIGLEEPIIFEYTNGNSTECGYGSFNYIPTFLCETVYFRDLYALYCTLYWTYNEGEFYNKSYEANPLEAAEEGEEGSEEPYKNKIYASIKKSGENGDDNINTLNKFIEELFMLQILLINLYYDGSRISKEKRDDEFDAYESFYENISSLFSLGL